MKREELTSDQRLLVGSLKEREEEARRQGIFECWETRARRDSEARQQKKPTS